MFMGMRDPASQSSVFRNGPVILGWQSGPTLDVSVGSTTEQIGERLYVIRARAVATGPAVFSGGSVQHRIVDADNIEGGEAGDGLLYMGRGTMTVDYRPLSFDGKFTVSSVALELARSTATPGTEADPLDALPPDQQPDPNQPLIGDPEAPDPPSGLPALQLYDRVGATWVEFQPLASGRTYSLTDPGRYVDAAGSLRIRFVLRDFNDYAEFMLGLRLEGSIE